MYVFYWPENIAIKSCVNQCTYVAPQKINWYWARNVLSTHVKIAIEEKFVQHFVSFSGRKREFIWIFGQMFRAVTRDGKYNMLMK